nr:hypothetical protein BHI3_03950 [Bacteriovorax sp. HI3]
MKNRITLLYLTLFVLIMAHVTQFLYILNLRPTDILWPVKWIPESAWFFTGNIMLGASLLSTFFLAVKSKHRLLRIISFVSVFFLLAMYFSYGKINHGFHQWIYVLAALMIPQNFKKETTDWWRQNLAGIFTLTYFCSGIWKIRGFFDFAISYKQYSLADYLRIQVNNATLDNGPSYFIHFFNSPSSNSFLILGALLVIALQVLPFLFVFKKKYLPAFICVALFHTMTLISLKVWFFQSIILAAILLLDFDQQEHEIKEN